jgi:multisubunit Na+/H+ antiporter MnhC subunit
MSDEPRQVFDGAEVLDGVPVLSENGHVESPRPAGTLTPAVVQTAAVVGASVVAGAAAVAIVHRRKARRLARRRRRMLGPVLASRSFLVDVHVLGDRK